MDVHIEDSWKEAVSEEFEKPYFKTLTERVRNAYTSGVPVYPPPKQIFRAFELCSFDAIRVVILGQDPYHGPHQAHGLCFSVEDGTPLPPSLKNIYKELRDDLGAPIPATGNLSGWGKQGVLLLNATLTVHAGIAGSHQGWGWEEFTDAIIKKVSEKSEHVVFLLWGKYAQSKRALIDETKHLVLTAAHPSPLSAHNGFFGCRHFSKTNAYLTEHGKKTISW